MNTEKRVVDTYKLGDPTQLTKKYGVYKPAQNVQKTAFVKKTGVNKNATFNVNDKITLPLEPSTLIVNNEQPTINIVKETNVKGNTRLDLLNFIDIAKLKENRSGFKIKSYDLKSLSHLARLLDIFKNEKPKLYFLEKIKEEMDKVFNNDNNLIADIKELSNDQAKQIKNITKIFNKHDISEPTKTELLYKINILIKDYRTTDDMVNIIIDLIEHQWIVTTKTKTKK